MFYVRNLVSPGGAPEVVELRQEIMEASQSISIEAKTYTNMYNILHGDLSNVKFKVLEWYTILQACGVVLKEEKCKESYSKEEYSKLVAYYNHELQESMLDVFYILTCGTTGSRILGIRPFSKRMKNWLGSLNIKTLEEMCCSEDTIEGHVQRLKDELLSNLK